MTADYDEVIILLIDDDEDDRMIFSMATKDTDFKIRCEFARGAEEAITALDHAETLPHFIFLDLNMPVMDGRYCLKELKANKKTRDIPVIVFSTSSERKDIDETKQLGAAGFMTKPADIDELTTMINNFLSNQLETQTR